MFTLRYEVDFYEYNEFRVVEVRAMGHAFCQRGATKEARFPSEANPCEIRGGYSDTGVRFSPTL